MKTNIVLGTSVFTTGFSIGGLVWPILYQIFLDAYTWRGAFLLQAAFGLNSCILIMIQTSKLLNHSPPAESNKAVETKKLETDIMLGELKENGNYRQIQETVVKNNDEVSFYNRIKHFLRTDLTIWDFLIIMACFLYNSGDAFTHYMIAVRMDYIDLTKQEMVTAMSARGAIGLIRVLPSYLIDKYKLNRTKTAGTLSLLIGLSTMASVTFTTFPTVLIFFLAWGMMQCKSSFNLSIVTFKTIGLRLAF